MPIDFSGKVQMIEKILSPILKQFNAQGQGAPTPGLPGQVGGAPPGMVAPPPQAGQSPASAGGGGGGGGAISPQQSTPQFGQVTPALAPTPQSPLMQTGFEFRTKAGAHGATTAAAVQSVGQFINDQRRRREEGQAKEAQNLMLLLMEAQKNPDDPKNKAIIQAITSDPKKVKILEKAYGEVMKLGEQPELSPAAKGVQAAVAEAKKGESNGGQNPNSGQGGKMLPTLGPTPEARVTASGQNTQLMADQAAQKGLSFGPQQMDALKGIINKADPEIQPAMHGLLEVAGMFPGAAQSIIPSIFKAQADFVSDKAAFGNKIALVNMQEQFRASIEATKEQARTMLQMALENSKDKRQEAMFRQQWGLLDKRLEFESDKLDKQLSAKNAPKPLTPQQSIAVTQTKDITQRVLDSLNEVLKPENQEVIKSLKSSISARAQSSILGRITPSTKAELAVSASFTRLKEQSNIFRKAYAATGFRGHDALQALWGTVAAENWWYANPDVTKLILEEAREDAMRLNQEAGDALSVGKANSSGGGTPSETDTKIDPNDPLGWDKEKK